VSLRASAARFLRREPLDHRAAVGGLWDEMGPRQLAFMIDMGLEPQHALLDVGCGSLRGGVHFVRYLDPGNYFGVDIDAALLDAGRSELEAAGLGGKAVTLLRDDAFRFGRLGRRFDFALAQSVFTHLPLNTIMRCLAEVERALEPGGRLFATYFENPGPRLGTEPHDAAEGITTHCDADPFHYDPDVFRWAVAGSSLECEALGDWGHPRNQRMLAFTKR
jgi:SAM-dependent methyltransferase